MKWEAAGGGEIFFVTSSSEGEETKQQHRDGASWRLEAGNERRMGLRLTNLVIYTFYVFVFSFLLLGWVVSIPYLHYTYNVLFAKLDTKTIGNETPRGNIKGRKDIQSHPSRVSHLFSLAIAHARFYLSPTPPKRPRPERKYSTAC